MLSERSLHVLICFANGMHRKTVASTLGLSADQVRLASEQIRRELGAKNIAEAVAKAWRLCLIEADEIEGGPAPPIIVVHEDLEEALLNYLDVARRIRPPREPWPALRARAARIAREYRSGVHRPALRVEGEL